MKFSPERDPCYDASNRPATGGTLAGVISGQFKVHRRRLLFRSKNRIESGRGYGPSP